MPGTMHYYYRSWAVIEFIKINVEMVWSFLYFYYLINVCFIVESSAGVLMPGVGSVLAEHLFDSEHLESLMATGPVRRRGRSGSCTELPPTPRPPLKHTPTSPKPDADCFKLLTRCGSKRVFKLRQIDFVGYKCSNLIVKDLV